VVFLCRCTSFPFSFDLGFVDDHVFVRGSNLCVLQRRVFESVGGGGAGGGSSMGDGDESDIHRGTLEDAFQVLYGASAPLEGHDDLMLFPDLVAGEEEGNIEIFFSPLNISRGERTASDDPERGLSAAAWQQPAPTLTFAPQHRSRATAIKDEMEGHGSDSGSVGGGSARGVKRKPVAEAGDDLYVGCSGWGGSFGACFWRMLFFPPLPTTAPLVCGCPWGQCLLL
jgi:hypothetical protein